MESHLYDRIASYEKTYWWYRGKRKLLQTLLKGTFEKSLDIGCGVGSNLQVLAGVSKEVVGLDNALEAVKYCKQKGFKVVFGNAEKLPFKKESFDLVVASDILEHLNDSKALAEINRVLKEGGKLIVTVPAFKMLWTKKDDRAHHLRRYNKKMLRQVLIKNNFKVFRTTYWNILMFIPIFLFARIQKSGTGSNVQRTSPFFDNILFFLNSLETAFLKIGNLPFGVSLVAVARKKQ